MAMSRYSIAALLVALAVTGCASKKPDGAVDAQAVVDQQIMDAAQKIQMAQADLYQAGALNGQVTRIPTSIMDGRQRVTLSWQGDALQLLNKLAHDRGLEFSFMGVRMPLPVSIDVKDMPYQSVLSMLRAQVGYRANIDQTSEKLVLQYNRPQG